MTFLVLSFHREKLEEYKYTCSLPEWGLSVPGEIKPGHWSTTKDGMALEKVQCPLDREWQ